MDDPLALGWLTRPDRRILSEVAAVAPPTAAPDRVRESLGLRLLIAVGAPFWLALIGGDLVRRLLLQRRPLLVVHERVGLAGRPLWVPKLPTMRVDANQARLGGLVEVATGPPVEGEVGDRVDAWLRESGLDELPQLALIVGGRMRLVGPRPVTPHEHRTMLAAGPVAVDRLPPGLLGVWQLLDRDAYTLEERRLLDLWMLERWSPALRRQVVRTGVIQAARRLARR